MGEHEQASLQRSRPVPKRESAEPTDDQRRQVTRQVTEGELGRVQVQLFAGSPKFHAKLGIALRQLLSAWEDDTGSPVRREEVPDVLDRLLGPAAVRTNVLTGDVTDVFW
jgi:hypothetical protein